MIIYHRATKTRLVAQPCINIIAHLIIHLNQKIKRGKQLLIEKVNSAINSRNQTIAKVNSVRI